MLPRVSRKHRRGMMMAAVIVGLMVVMLLSAAMAEMLVTHNRAARSAEQRQQTFWLAESALARARQRLRQDPAYAGETWVVPPSALGDAGAGTAVIQVQRSDESGSIMLVRVEARFPGDSDRATVQHREQTVHLTSPGGES